MAPSWTTLKANPKTAHFIRFEAHTAQVLGQTKPLTLFDAQCTLYAAQDEAVQLQLARLQVCVALYKALGGGWQSPQGRGHIRRDASM